MAAALLLLATALLLLLDSILVLRATQSQNTKERISHVFYSKLAHTAAILTLITALLEVAS